MLNKKVARLRRAKKTRKRIYLSGKPRLSVFKSSRHLYAQVFSHDGAKVLVSCCTLEEEVKKKVPYTGNIQAAEVVGKLIAERTIKAGITEVAFDRSGFMYHGRLKALADQAREVGLKF
jgi:large subunit ribosomal protein L18